MGHTPIPDLVWSPPLYTPPPPVSPLIYGKKGGLNRGVNAVTEIFPEIFWKSDFYPYFRKKIFPEIFGNLENLFKFVIFNQITMDKKLLNEAKNKRKTRNILTEKDYRLDIKDFILKIYTNCTPNKYGESFPTKLQVDAGDFLGRIPTYMDRGDLHIKYKKFMEGKISFLDIKGCYSITNIRDWQDFDFFILCFVDHNFKPSFYCVRKSVITNNPKIRLHGMNNVSKINSFNKYVGKRTTIDAKDINFLFKNNNLLKGTSYKNLISFLKNLNNQ